MNAGLSTRKPHSAWSAHPVWTRFQKHRPLLPRSGGTGRKSPSSSGSSPWVIKTPASSENGSSPNLGQSARVTVVETSSLANTQAFKPLSKVWVVLKKKRKRRRTTDKPPRVPVLKPACRRRPFQDEEMRVETALTREPRSCVRCRMQRIRVGNYFLTPCLSTIASDHRLIH
ncbi:hypothetical protein B0H67DRAFT_242089 [Lasiosphaeris hirsuta]|uniref:Uncharacterized protein n=1 Tax=Lasiosphaeris hirsuta TaxID=260670 RepID=A0AA40AGQ7_9PEZI|nr:hypothetical protein B0H67DRAFT_242089 [Lasiosphaeris hirsuta]